MKKLLPWLAVLLLLATVFGTMYAVVQQVQRSDANSPQIQLAQDTAASLDHGDAPQVLVYGTVNITTSISPFMTIYDKTGNAVISSGYLDSQGKVPKAPFGMLAASKTKAYSAVTWQPQHGVRIAAVTVSSKDYYVLSGRSLKEVEKNELRTLEIILLGGVIALILFGLVYVLSALSEGY